MKTHETEGNVVLKQFMSTTGTSTLLYVLIGTVLLQGCGESQPVRVPVAGKVLIDGKPLAHGTIRFVPEHGRPSSSKILSDGTFDVAATTLDQNPIKSGVIPGKYRVSVSASEAIDEESMRWHAPKKYASYRTSGLEQTIEGPSSDLVIELTWDGVEGPVVERMTEMDNSAIRDAGAQTADQISGEPEASSKTGSKEEEESVEHSDSTPQP